jgi:hypothetical protein
MESNTSILNIAGTLYVRVPSNMAKYFRLSDIKENGECKIKDLTKNKAELTFKKW